MNIKIDFSIPISICPYCLGSGKVKVAQLAMLTEGVSIRVNDGEELCKKCKAREL